MSNNMNVLLVQTDQGGSILIEAAVHKAGFPLLVANGAVSAINFVESGYDIDVVIIDGFISDSSYNNLILTISSFFKDVVVNILLLLDPMDVAKLGYSNALTPFDILLKPLCEISLGVKLRHLYYNNNKFRNMAKMIDKSNSLTFIDPITRFVKLNGFKWFAEKLHKQSVRNSKSFSVMAISIDKFEKYELSFCESEVNHCVAMIGVAIENNINRPLDIVSSVSRSTFYLFLYGADHNGAMHVASNIRSSIAKLSLSMPSNRILPAGVSKKIVTASIFSATYSGKDDQEFDSVLRTLEYMAEYIQVQESSYFGAHDKTSQKVS